MCNFTHSVSFYTQFAPFCREIIFVRNLRCFVAWRFSSQIYALFSVKFSELKKCWCKKSDKCQVWSPSSWSSSSLGRRKTLLLSAILSSTASIVGAFMPEYFSYSFTRFFLLYYKIILERIFIIALLYYLHHHHYHHHDADSWLGSGPRLVEIYFFLWNMSALVRHFFCFNFFCFNFVLKFSSTYHYDADSWLGSGPRGSSCQSLPFLLRLLEPGKLVSSPSSSSKLMLKPGRRFLL